MFLYLNLVNHKQEQLVDFLNGQQKINDKNKINNNLFSTSKFVITWGVVDVTGLFIIVSINKTY